MNANDYEDYWTQQSKAVEKQPDPHLKIQSIEGVIPFDEQFGVDYLKAVPDTLRDIMLGQPKPTKIELQKAGEDELKMPPLRTYAILDAAKVTNLPELLEASGLEHRCLFKGDAFDELKDVAPWIVRLEDDNGFTRNLFTYSDAPWHLWDKEPGIYLRSRGTLDEMWLHFRKFTKVQDDNAKWYYWRFWEPKWIIGLLSDMQSDQIHRFLPLGFQVIVVLSNGKVELAWREASSS